MSTAPLEVFAISQSDPPRGVVALARPDGIEDVPPKAIVGTVRMRDGIAQWDTLELTDRFRELQRDYMQGKTAQRPPMLDTAKVNPGEYVYVIDGRVANPRGEVPFHDIIGWYQSDRLGRPIAESFERNEDHRLVAKGVLSSIFVDLRLRRAAYDD